MPYPGAHDRQSTAIIHADSGRTLSYGELDDRSNALARYLRDAGLKTGSTIAFISPNGPEVYEVYWSGLRSGLYITGVNHNLTAAEAAFILQDSGAEALIVSADKAALAQATLKLAPGVRVALAYGGEVSGFLDYEEALAKGAASEPLAEQPRGADMLYSSGTTGRPKGVRPPLPSLQVDELGELNTVVFHRFYGFDDKTVFYSAAPSYHAAPLRFGMVTHAWGGTLVLRGGFDPEQALADIERFSVTTAQFVPTMFVRLLKLPEETRHRYDLSSLKTVIHAAAPCPVEVKRRMIEWWGPIIHEYYSSTEANGATFIDSQAWLDHPGSVGKAAVGTIHICDEGGRELAAGDIGTVFFERDIVPFEYHNDEEKTRSTQHPEHETWTTTGDIGYVDDEGYLYLTDRKAFTIISGGVNIYPQEVEDALALHPAVADVAVIGLPDEDWGQQVTAVVQVADGQEVGDLLAEEIVEFLSERLARFKLPRRVIFDQDLPRMPTGKLAKGKLVERYSTQPTP